jgi:primosomal protein N' (replication factor Y)
MYARIIVDVPAKQTNRAYDYRVPDCLKEWVEIGSRVGVPFGSRIVQGFVVGIEERSEVADSRLKDIAHVLDWTPPLTRELVELGRWMARKYLCHEITALQAMIPAALKARYEKWIRIAEDIPHGVEWKLEEETRILDFVRERGGVAVETLLKQFPGAGAVIRRLLGSGELVEERKMRNRLSAKKVLTVFPPGPDTDLRLLCDSLPGNARRQREVLQFLADHPEPVRLTELMNRLSVSAGTVKGLAERGWIGLREIEVFRDPYAGRTFSRTTPLPLTGEQRQVYEVISESLAAGRHEVFLLHGVTGSGKTEVYLQVIQRCLSEDREAIVLVPEISLTPQMVERFKGRFGDQVAVLHSRLSDGERYDEWRKIMLRKVRVVIGARSAIFAPFTRLGLIIIDEEHESSYKQDESPKYHARDVAIRRGRMNNAVVVLGSATPSLESYSQTGPGGTADSSGGGAGFRLLSMQSRVHGRPLPEVHIVDMREELKEGNRSMFSRSLHKALEDRLHKQEQAVLLLNRRGYATFVMCRTCGYVSSCPHCDISLTYHQSSHMMRCHYCGYAEREVAECPDCGSPHIRHFGTGTQRVEEELGKLFPGIRVIRMDVDTTTEKGSHEKWLTQFRNRQADVLLGTQMVAKGLDFPHVTLVGVIAADTVLNLPDFRSAEKTFQLLTQVAGRAGRHELPGEVFVQTYTPAHYSIQCASRHDYRSFVQTELETRRQRGYPPFQKLVLLTLSHEELPFLVKSAEKLAGALREAAGSAVRRPAFAAGGSIPGDDPGALEILGPVASPISRIKDRYRFQCMIKYRGDTEVSSIVQSAVSLLEDQLRKEKLQISIDVDPQVLL